MKWLVIAQVMGNRNGRQYHLGKIIECEYSDREPHVEQFMQEVFDNIEHGEHGVSFRLVEIFGDFKLLPSSLPVEMQDKPKKSWPMVRA